MFDVLVIGGGMAGVVAALAAAKAGASVALARRSWGATALGTGAIDIAYAPALSHVDQMPRTVAEHVMDIAAHRHRHPFAVLGLEATILGLRRGFATLGAALAGSGLEPGALDLEADNRHLPSSLGAAMPAATAYAPHLGLDLTQALAGRWGVVELLGDISFDAQRVAAALTRDAIALSGAQPELVPLRARFDGSAGPMATAARLDDVRFQDELGRALAVVAKGCAGLVVPPVLGLERHQAARERVARAVGIPVVEALAHLPSVPGVRLQRALDAAVARAGIANVGDIERASHAAGHVDSLFTRDRLELRAGTYILATGRFIAGGVGFAARCQEALFGLPLVTEDGLLEEDHPGAVVRETPMESHPLMTAGVPVTADLEPVREGAPAFDNLFAAGMVLGGFASRYALCADGVALASGWLAAAAALRRLGGGRR
jgi:glycerol-3-phosphate dehydrogenase subunit B